MAGASGAKFCHITRQTWIKVIKRLEDEGYIMVTRQRIHPASFKLAGVKPKPFNRINFYEITDKFKKIVKYAETQLRHGDALSVRDERPFIQKPVKKATKNFGHKCKAGLQNIDI